jgi:hypothetical protein
VIIFSFQWGEGCGENCTVLNALDLDFGTV